MRRSKISKKKMAKKGDCRNIYYGNWRKWLVRKVPSQEVINDINRSAKVTFIPNIE